MRRIREVPGPKDECAPSYLTIAASPRIGKDTVANYLAAAETATLNDAAIMGRFLPSRHVCRKLAVPDTMWVHGVLKRKGITLHLLGEEYREAAPGRALQPLALVRSAPGVHSGALRLATRQMYAAGEVVPRAPWWAWWRARRWSHAWI